MHNYFLRYVILPLAPKPKTPFLQKYTTKGISSTYPTPAPLSLHVKCHKSRCSAAPCWLLRRQNEQDIIATATTACHGEEKPLDLDFYSSNASICDAALAAPPGEVQWVTGDYVAGDVIIFGMATLHASTANCTSALRLSCDVRFQPAAEAADARYMGSAEEMATKAAQRKRGGAYAAAVDVGAASVPAAVTMLDLRTRWGLPSP